MDNNLVVSNNLNQLANKGLKKELVSMLKAMETISKSTWNYAKAMHKIIDEEMFVDDFKTVKRFAKECVKVAPSTITKYVNAVKGLKVIEKYGYNENNFTVSKSNIIYSLGENAKSYLDYVTIKDIHIELMSEQEMVLNIKNFLGANEEAVESGNNETETEAKEEVYIEIEYNGKKYHIPESVLSKYEVTDEEE